MGEIANAYVQQMTDGLMARVMAVRDAATVTTTYDARCSTCGPLTREMGQGIAIHAVSNPGHIVTVVNVTTTTYEDRGGPADAAGTGTQDSR